MKLFARAMLNHSFVFMKKPSDNVPEGLNAVGKAL